MMIGLGQYVPEIRPAEDKVYTLEEMAQLEYIQCESACWQRFPDQPEAVGCIAVVGVSCPPAEYTPEFRACVDACREAAGFAPLPSGAATAIPGWLILAAAVGGLLLLLGGSK